jgi:DNA replicative helicase MCM subunit Mcm2 (Cdc46/Mcm family)
MYTIYLEADSITINSNSDVVAEYEINDDEYDAIEEAFQTPQFWDMFVGSILASIEDDGEDDE